MADRGHELTDKILVNLEKDIAAEYSIAVRDMREKLEDYLEKDEAKRKIQEKLLNDGAISQQEYNDWCYRHMMMGKRWENMLNALAKDMHKTNEIALKISREKQPDVCALNANYATYQIEHDGELDTGMSLYNHDAAEHLLEQQRQLMPGPSTKKAAEIAANKDMQWNYKKIQSAVLQGILQGESPYDVAKRLNTVGRMNYNDSVRYARTMTTNSQNAGRYQAFRRARDLGVDLTIEWQATLDGRTRHSHRMMHGQRRDVDEPFEVDGVKILWPGNDKVGSSDVPQSMIWNCRCTLLSWVKGFEGETVKESPKMGDMSFEEWQNDKNPNKNKDFTSPNNDANINTNRSSLTKINASGEVLNPMPRQEYETIRDALVRNGKTVRAVLPTDTDDLFRYMQTLGIDGSYGNGVITHLGEVPSRGTLYEEIIHMAQARKYGELVVGDEVERCAREVEAARKMLKFKDAYKLDNDDVENLTLNLAYWEKRFAKEFGAGYDDSNYRGTV